MKKLCDFCTEKCPNKECTLIPRITKGTYECSVALDGNLLIDEVVYMEDVPFVKVKALVVPKRFEGQFFGGEQTFKWYTVNIKTTEKWKRRKDNE